MHLLRSFCSVRCDCRCSPARLPFASSYSSSFGPPSWPSSRSECTWWTWISSPTLRTPTLPAPIRFPRVRRPLRCAEFQKKKLLRPKHLRPRESSVRSRTMARFKLSSARARDWRSCVVRSERFDAGTTSERDANGISRRRCRGGGSAEEQSGEGGFAEKPETAGSTGLQEGGDRGARGRDGAAGGARGCDEGQVVRGRRARRTSGARETGRRGDALAGEECRGGARRSA